MTPTEVEVWVESAPWSVLERRVRAFTDEAKRTALAWAKTFMDSPDGNVARTRFAVAVIGTLEPGMLDNYA